jgi:asparagine synthase (glutamine-hydrolysing)
MNFSLEARVPYLDYRLVEYNLSSYSNMIINKGSTKYILREAMRKILPEEIRTRMDKVGFETPQDKWFRTPKWQSRINDVISSSNLSPYIYKNIATKLYNDHLQGNKNIAKEIWKWINLDRWLESAKCEKRN